MGLFDRIFGRDERDMPPAPGSAPAPASDDEQAIARYRYMLKTAPPEAVEQTHAEAFAKLTPDQRRRVLQELAAELPAGERETVLRGGETPAVLARAATRAELRQPGTLERTFGRMGPAGPGLGGLMAGTFLSTMAGAVLGTALAQSFMSQAAPDAGLAADAGAEGGFDTAADAGGFDGGDVFDV